MNRKAGLFIGRLTRQIADIKTHGSRLKSSLASLREEVEKFDDSLSVNAAHTPPRSWYTDKDFYEFEQATLFKNNWIAACGAHSLKKAGDYVTGTIGQEPYLISKDKDDKLHYFYNVCRHHGTQLCDAAKGNTDEFVCPYHAWRFALDGRLTKAVRLRNIENFSAKDYGLNRMSGTNWFGCLFINQNTDANGSHFHKKLEELNRRLEHLGCHENNLTFITSEVFAHECNWKLVMDNFSEGYHVPECHKRLSSIIDLDSYNLEFFDGFATHRIDPDDKQSRVGQGVMFTNIYPNAGFNRYGNWVDVNYVIPTGPETCDVVYDWYMDTDVYNNMSKREREEVIASTLKESIQVQNEDKQIVERLQKGLRSSSFTYGRYAPLLEHAQHDFHRALTRDYKKGLEEMEKKASSSQQKL